MTAERPDLDGPIPELFSDDEWQRIARTLHLPPRQAAIARMMCRGLKREAIALRLGVSPNTVRSHVRALLRRCRASTRTELLARLFLLARRLAEQPIILRTRAALRPGNVAAGPHSRRQPPASAISEGRLRRAEGH